MSRRTFAFLTTAALAYGKYSCLPNARFTTSPTPETQYTAVGVRRP